MIEVTITIPLANIPGVEVEARSDYLYASPEIEALNIDKLALEFRGDAAVDYPDNENPDVPIERQWDRIAVAEGWHRLKKPRLVVMP